MFEFLFKVWYLIAILPFFILLDGSKMFAKFLKERNIYYYWDMWHSSVVFFIILLMILWANGFRP